METIKDLGLGRHIVGAWCGKRKTSHNTAIPLLGSFDSHLCVKGPQHSNAEPSLKSRGKTYPLSCVGADKTHPQAAYTVNVAYAILCALYGLGTPDDQLTMPHVVRALYAYTGWEVSYCIAIDLAKTSIGVAILRIAGHQPAHRRVVWALLFVTNVLYVGCGIWVLAMCSAGGAPWNMLYNTCAANTIIVPLLYCAVAIGAATDAGFALVPIFIVRGLQMETRLKRTLMIVMGLGSLAAVASLSRFPWGRYMPPHYGNMCRSAHLEEQVRVCPGESGKRLGFLEADMSD